MKNTESHPMAIITRDETRLKHELENGFKIFTPSGIVVYIEEETLYQLVRKIDDEEVHIETYDDSIEPKEFYIEISEDNETCFVDMSFTDICVTCYFSLKTADLYMYYKLYLHESDIENQLKDQIIMSLKCFLTGE